MERMRRVYRGTASELFGKEALPLDKMSRHVGFFRMAKESIPLLRDEEIEMLEAYSAGVNAFLDNISFIGGKTCTANLLPPELVVLGVNQLEPWEPADTLALARLMGL
jgi:penicillin amidase